MAIRISGRVADQSHDLPRLDVAAERLLGEDEAAVNRHVEDPARRWHEADFGIGKGLFQLSRQTGGSGLVVSNDAVLDRDEHAAVPLEFYGVFAANRSVCTERSQGEAAPVTRLLVTAAEPSYLFEPCEPTHGPPGTGFRQPSYGR
jgi:hypothetical protein